MGAMTATRKRLTLVVFIDYSTVSILPKRLYQSMIDHASGHVQQQTGLAFTFEPAAWSAWVEKTCHEFPCDAKRLGLE